MVERLQGLLSGSGIADRLSNLSLPGQLGLLSTAVSLQEGQPLGQAVKTGLGTFGGLQQIDQQQRQREGIEALKKRFANNPKVLALIDANPTAVMNAITAQAFTPVDNFKIREASQDIINAYIETLSFSNIKVTYRKSRGKDIDAACGQLANKLISN